MNYLKVFFISISGFILIIIVNTNLVKRDFSKKTEIALEDYSMLPDDIKVTDKVILGRGDDRYRPGAISLICTNKNNILLIVQDYKPTRHGKAAGIGKAFFSGHNSTTSKATSFKHKKTAISNMTYLYRGYFDVYVSDPLSQQEITSILEILRIENLTHIGIVAFDGGASFTSELNFLEVEKLTNNCQ